MPGQKRLAGGMIEMIPDFSYYPTGLYLGVGFYLMWIIFEHLPRLFWNAWDKCAKPGYTATRSDVRPKPPVGGTAESGSDYFIPEPPVGGTGESTSAHDEMIQDIVDRASTTGISQFEAQILGGHYRHNYDPDKEGYPTRLFGKPVVYADP